MLESVSERLKLLWEDEYLPPLTPETGISFEVNGE
jgi:hypothetical protein